MKGQVRPGRNEPESVCSTERWREKETERWREGRAFQSGGKAPPAEKGKHPGINC